MGEVLVYYSVSDSNGFSHRKKPLLIDGDIDVTSPSSRDHIAKKAISDFIQNDLTRSVGDYMFALYDKNANELFTTRITRTIKVVQDLGLPKWRSPDDPPETHGYVFVRVKDTFSYHVVTVDIAYWDGKQFIKVIGTVTGWQPIDYPCAEDA